MTANEARDEIKRRWRELWQADKGKGDERGVICPLCGNGSGEAGDGVKQDTRKGGFLLHCFKCGFSGDAITLLRREIGGGFRDALEEGAKRLSLSVDWNHTSAGLKAPAQTNGNRARNDEMGATGTNYHAGEEKPPNTDFSAFIESARVGLADERAKAYLEGRGISIETAARLGVGFDSAWKNPKGGKFSSPRIILPFLDGVGYLARGLDDVAGCKQNGGAVGLFNGEALRGGGVVFVCEGAFDALSVEETGRRAVAINGASNGGVLIQALQAMDFAGVLVLALDDDDAGRDGTEKIKAGLDSLGFPYIVGDACGGFKDENAFLCADRDGFDFCLLELEAQAREILAKTASPDSIEAYITGGGWLEDVERGASNREKTGFPALDDWLGGGLYEGLTVLSGFPSLGKTSLLWQIAENVAAGGCHVLFFALEMARADMVSKSLARRAHLRGRDVTSDDAQSGRDACLEELKGLLQDVGSRLEVVEGSFGYGVEKIRRRIMQAKRQGGRLAVFVDYLQAAADYKGGGSEITAISDTAKALRQMARELHCPIVCASSTARSGYSCAVDYSSFYGSGGIEFAADVAAGLQLSAVYSPEYKDAGRERTGAKEKQAALIEKAKRENPRRVSLVGLKNRRGQMSCRIDFLFDARHCTFAGDVSFLPSVAVSSSGGITADDLEGLLDI